MKKAMVLLLLLLCLPGLAGCSSRTETGVQPEEQESSTPVVSTPVEAPPNEEPLWKELEFRAGYFRTDGYAEGESYPKERWITCVEELEEYCRENEDRYDFSGRDGAGFADAVADYDDAFFTEHDLILLVLEEPSGSIRHEVSRVLLEPSSLNRVQYLLQPVIERKVPEVGTADMAEWHILIEVSKEYGAAHSELQPPELVETR